MPSAVLIGTRGTQTVHVVLALKCSLSAGRMDKRRLLSRRSVVGVPARLWVESLGERGVIQVPEWRGLGQEAGLPQLSLERWVGLCRAEGKEELPESEDRVNKTLGPGRKATCSELSGSGRARVRESVRSWVRLEGHVVTWAETKESGFLMAVSEHGKW